MANRKTKHRRRYHKLYLLPARHLKHPLILLLPRQVQQVQRRSQVLLSSPINPHGGHVSCFLSVVHLRNTPVDNDVEKFNHAFDFDTRT